MSVIEKPIIDRDFEAMDLAVERATHSPCNKRKVGCVIYTDSRILRPLSYGWNKPENEGDSCEDEKGITTLPTTIHAEEMAIKRVPVKFDVYGKLHMAVTHTPCLYCIDRILITPIRNLTLRMPVESHRMKRIEFMMSMGISIKVIE